MWEYVSDSVNSFIQGYNVSILAYGQSGAGKSYTMGTSMPEEHSESTRTGRLNEATSGTFQSETATPNSHEQGIVPRAARKLFEKLSGGPGPSAPGPGAGRPVSIGGASGLRPPKRYNAAAEQGDRNWQLRATYVEVCYPQMLGCMRVPMG